MNVTDNGNGWYDVNDGQYDWSISRGCDGVLTIEITNAPDHKRDRAVLLAVQKQL